MEFMLWFLLFFAWHGLGVTIGYHRVLTHQSAKVKKPLLYLLVLGGYLSMQGAPIAWASTHRYHHQTTDTPKDPHTPTRGFWYAFNGWIWFGNEPSRDYLVADLIKDPFLKFLGTGALPSRWILNISSCILLRVLIFILFGKEALIASILAGIIIFIAPQTINTLCHMPKLGSRNYETKDLSTNIPWLNIINFGEAWHNNHHARPKRLRLGEKGELDIGYEFCKLFKKLKLMDFKDV